MNLQLGKTATVQEISEWKPGAIICATGSRPYTQGNRRSRDPRIIMSDDLFSSTKKVGDNVLVFDFVGDWPGMEAAIYLAEKGHGVTLISSRLHIGETVHQYLRNEYLKKLYNLNVTLLPHYDIGTIKEDHVTIRNLFNQQKEELTNWDSIVLSLDRIPNTELFEEMKGHALIVKQIWDCFGPRTIEEATHEGIMSAISL
ncbi:FAD-dependent oxidoreductase [Peribacillus simplex]|uniref:FAD-dependent oxidoreductase n=1 Tax=Peribacillus TaxID=2675229 RepID=UPI0017837F59|nr:FAD-dependent oxidoreductase [Brevibacillus sp. JNUCC-41]QOS90812.1 FAD-dependent oxidoreductase [Brevibacillus sp. JNUCC-41]